MRFETLKTSTEHAFVWAPIQPGALTDTSTVRVEVTGLMIDTAGAVLAIAAASPDWVATADLSYRSISPVREGPVICSSRLVRAGATIPFQLVAS